FVNKDSLAEEELENEDGSLSTTLPTEESEKKGPRGKPRGRRNFKMDFGNLSEGLGQQEKEKRRHAGKQYTQAELKIAAVDELLFQSDSYSKIEKQQGAKSSDPTGRRQAISKLTHVALGQEKKNQKKFNKVSAPGDLKNEIKELEEQITEMHESLVNENYQ